MREDQEAPQPTEPEGYVPPTVTDLGAFEEITKLNPGLGGDLEGTSGGPPV